MPEDKEEGIEVGIDDNNDDFEMIEPITSSEDVEEGSTEQVEIFKEEVVTVVKNPNAEEKKKEKENEEQAFRIDNSIGEDENVCRQVKAQVCSAKKINRCG